MLRILAVKTIEAERPYNLMSERHVGQQRKWPAVAALSEEPLANGGRDAIVANRPAGVF